MKYDQICPYHSAIISHCSGVELLAPVGALLLDRRVVSRPRGWQRSRRKDKRWFAGKSQNLKWGMAEWPKNGINGGFAISMFDYQRVNQCCKSNMIPICNPGLFDIINIIVYYCMLFSNHVCAKLVVFMGLKGVPHVETTMPNSIGRIWQVSSTEGTRVDLSGMSTQMVSGKEKDANHICQQKALLF